MESFQIAQIKVEGDLKHVQFQIRLPRNVHLIKQVRVTTTLNTQLESLQEVGSITLRIPGSSDTFFSEAVRSIFPQHDLTYYKPDYNNFPDARPGWAYGTKEDFLTVNMLIHYPVLECYYVSNIDSGIPHFVTIYLRLES